MFGFVSVKVEGIGFKHQKQMLTVLQGKKKKKNNHKNQLIYLSDTGDSQQFQDVDGISLENRK